MSEPFFGNFDLAQLALYAFWVFFAGLIIYLQRENMREGYPLVDDDGNAAPNQGPFGEPDEKTFHLPHDRGDVTVPKDREETRTLPLERSMPSGGYPFEPTGDALKDGVGPAAWAGRQDWPELDGHGNPKIAPMRAHNEYTHAAGRDPRGMDVMGRDGVVVGKISDMWIDKPEFLVRYLEIDLAEGGKRLVPMTMARITKRGVIVESMTAPYFAGVPETKSDSQITLLEEDKVSAYYCGGRMYAN